MTRVLAKGVVCLALLASPADALTQLVETFPVETTLDNADIPDAADVWIDMIDAAERTLDFAEFYASNEPGSRLEAVVLAIERASARGVRVRFLSDAGFYETYPETLDRLDALPTVTVRRYDVRSVMGGVLHAKMFLVDGREAFIGSQNFDWRALQHIQELGVRSDEPAVVAPLADVFELDWSLAGGASMEDARARVASERKPRESAGEVRAVFSPTGWLPEGVSWDLPAIVSLLDGAEDRIRVQLLTYATVGRDGTFFEVIDNALHRAAARGVRVELLLADWGKRRHSIDTIKRLQLVDGIDVRFAVVPPFSGGFIPYARVTHAKYAVVDGARAWIGTSNWEKSYFHTSRNAGVMIEGGSIPARLDTYFENGWNSPYAEPVDVCREYEPPRIRE